MKDLTPALPEDYLELHLRENEVRKQELELKRNHDKNNLEYAKEYLKNQAENFRRIRENEREFEKHLMFILALFVIMIFSLAITAMLLNKDDLIIEIVKAAGYLFGGGITGYGLSLRNGKARERIKI